jgi:hypothetical protein
LKHNLLDIFFLDFAPCPLEIQHTPCVKPVIAHTKFHLAPIMLHDLGHQQARPTVKTHFLGHSNHDGSSLHVLVQERLSEALSTDQKVADIIETIINNAVQELFRVDSPAQFIAYLFGSILVANLIKVTLIIMEQPTREFQEVKYNGDVASQALERNIPKSKAASIDIRVKGRLEAVHHHFKSPRFLFIQPAGDNGLNHIYAVRFIKTVSFELSGYPQKLSGNLNDILLFLP